MVDGEIVSGAGNEAAGENNGDDGDTSVPFPSFIGVNIGGGSEDALSSLKIESHDSSTFSAEVGEGEIEGKEVLAGNSAPKKGRAEER